MDPRAVVKVSVDSLALRLPPALAVTESFFCEIKLGNSPVQVVSVPCLPPSPSPSTNGAINGTANGATNGTLNGVMNGTVNGTVGYGWASFYLDEIALRKVLAKKPSLEVVVFAGARKGTRVLSSWFRRRPKPLGCFKAQASAEWGSGKSVEVHHGWAGIGGKTKTAGAELHLCVWIEPDPRFVFRFDGEMALSPQIVQIQGNSCQPVFSCKFTRDRNPNGRLGQFDNLTNVWAGTSDSEEKERRERKGWLVTIHDLSGSAVAAASMVTPFVAMPGLNRVSKSNPGAWLILRPDPSGVDRWQSWGRLEAWLESGGAAMGCRFHLLSAEGIGFNALGGMETLISARKGGEFMIDTGKLRSASSPPDSPQSIADPPSNMEGGLPSSNNTFVMSCIVPASGKKKKNNEKSKPIVQLAARHVTCIEDAAVFMALAAAVDLSVDACQPFTGKTLRKELSSRPERL